MERMTEDGSCQNDFYRPVLKHGPRSFTTVRVYKWKTYRRIERKFEVRIFSTDLQLASVSCMRKSIVVKTRKKVNYT